MRQVLDLQGQLSRADRRRLQRIVRGMFRYNLQNYLSAFAMPAFQKETFLRRTHIRGSEHLEAALAQGKGVILFSAHFGPFNELIHWLALKGYATTIPVERLKDERILNLMLGLRRSQGINFIPLGGSSPIRELFSALRHNQIVLITADRAIEGQSIVKPFFGANASLPIGPAQIAQRTGAALVGAFGWYKTEDFIEGEFLPLSLKLSEERRRDVECLMDGVIETLEQVIAAHPDQWIVFSPIWTDSADVVPGKQGA
jgi:phosphatidylinositol dimannoside acyltransferase